MMRYERKYKIDNVSLAVVEQSLLLHPAGFRKIYPDRQVNNIYFDTLGLQTFHENVDGIAQRKKYRVRWYADDPFQIKKPIFEIKIKNNQVGTKKSTVFDEFSLDQLDDVTHQVKKQDIDFAKLVPVLQNSYQRSYYGTSDGQYRITIDRNLCYFSYLMSSKFDRYTTRDAGIVMEVKYDQTVDNSTNRIMPFIPYRLTKSSKYVTGVLLTNG